MPAPPARRQSEPRLDLTARIPKSLRHEVRLYCVEHGVEVQQFVAEALGEALRRRGWR
jgi:hypothetical protein